MVVLRMLSSFRLRKSVYNSIKYMQPYDLIAGPSMETCATVFYGRNLLQKFLSTAQQTNRIELISSFYK